MLAFILILILAITSGVIFLLSCRLMYTLLMDGGGRGPNSGLLMLLVIICLAIIPPSGLVFAMSVVYLLF